MESKKTSCQGREAHVFSSQTVASFAGRGFQGGHPEKWLWTCHCTLGPWLYLFGPCEMWLSSEPALQVQQGWREEGVTKSCQGHYCWDGSQPPTSLCLW